MPFQGGKLLCGLKLKPFAGIGSVSALFAVQGLYPFEWPESGNGRFRNGICHTQGQVGGMEVEKAPLFLLSNGDKPGIRKFLESVFRGCPFACRRTAGSSLFRSRKTFSWQGGRRVKGEKEGFHEQEGEWSRRRGNGIRNEKPCSLPFFGMRAAGGGTGSTVKFCVKGA